MGLSVEAKGVFIQLVADAMGRLDVLPGDYDAASLTELDDGSLIVIEDGILSFAHDTIDIVCEQLEKESFILAILEECQGEANEITTTKRVNN